MRKSTLLIAAFMYAIGCLSVYGQESAEKIYDTVDQVPLHKKNRGNVQKYLSKNIKYPVDALAKEIEGKVMVSFVVSSLGEINDVKLVEGLFESIDTEALRVVKTMKEWKPAKLDGELVAAKVTIPVHFYLSEENKALAEQIKPFYLNDHPPLFVLDNKKVMGVTTLDYFNVKSIRVIKGKKALDLYGEEGKNGVLVVQTKRGTSRDYQMY
ncbi:energy transducer TonB [Labilibacter marinus]|uniref:energy transducer TonB n=1 Tax=Labilibacter marinus TaxID=1477105 RepID=UPI00094F8AB9|nr:energy transducer TonB [Labilibacter marinus]